MQTLKTAIVVLLLMTVMYGSYVSLTTPPEPLPDTVTSLIEESGSFEMEIDAGLPESLANLTNDFGQTGLNSQSPVEMSLPDFAMPPSPEKPTSPPNSQLADVVAPANLKSSGNQAAVTKSFTDKSPNPLTAPNPLASVGNPSSQNQNSLEQLQLPKPSSLSSAPTIDPARDYPTTGPSGMPLPDPNSLATLPSTGWKRDAKPVSFELPSKDNAVTAPLSSGPNIGLANAIRTADRLFAADQHLDALSTLSLFYNTPDLSQADREALVSRLDPLAASVIYSRQHLLEQPHRVAANETLMEIATRYELPWQLLANINGIEDPVVVLPGTELKVMRGPFRAEVDLQRSELTIFVRDLYAGRFSIVVGNEPAPQAGTYTIQDKQTARTFYDKNGSPVPPGDSRNPYGSVWMDLGKQLCIHGSPERGTPTNQGCISLCGDDADDLVGILSQGSSVTIRR